MKLVIIGAGGSFDCNYKIIDKTLESWKPPLGNELFDVRENFRDIINHYDGAKALSSAINTTEDIENYFQSKWNFILENRADDLLAKIINVQYYLQNLLHNISEKYSVAGLNNYDVLMDFAYQYIIEKKEDVCFITFNYDTLLEKSLEKTFNMKILNVNQYLDTPIKILKLHGSCNWYKQFSDSFMASHNSGIQKEGDISKFLYNNKFNLQQIYDGLEKEIVILNTPNRRNLYNEDIYNENIAKCFFPQIMIPMKNKDEFVLPTEHYQYLDFNLQNVNEILIIGWKGSEEYFHELLKKRIGNKNVSITHVNIDKTLEDNMKSVLPKSTITHYTIEATRRSQSVYDGNVPGTFTEYIKDISNNKYVNFFKIN